MLPDEALTKILEKTSKKGDNKINIMEFRNEKQKVYLDFFTDTKKMEDVIKLHKKSFKIKDNDLLIVIIISELKPNETVLKLNINNTQIYWYKQLLFDVSEHSLVPKHELIEKFKADEIKKKYYLNSIKLLPYISIHDPIAKYYDMRYGDICKITRHVSNVGESIYYRLVMDN
jgi:DNA-directed RNA polymerase subunit H (RpoH/RPB5)